MSYKSLSLLSAALVAILANVNTGNTEELSSFEKAVISQLVCEAPPSPLPILEALERARLIYAQDQIGFDGISCFRIKGGVKIAGLKFNSVCAHEQNDSIRAKRPDLLWRGPGTSPGQFLSFGTTVMDSVVAKWYFHNVGKRHLNEAIVSEDTSIGDNTEVICSSWFSG